MKKKNLKLTSQTEKKLTLAIRKKGGITLPKKMVYTVLKYRKNQKMECEVSFCSELDNF